MIGGMSDDAEAIIPVHVDQTSTTLENYPKYPNSYRDSQIRTLLSGGILDEHTTKGGIKLPVDKNGKWDYVRITRGFPQHVEVKGKSIDSLIANVRKQFKIKAVTLRTVNDSAEYDGYLTFDNGLEVGYKWDQGRYFARVYIEMTCDGFKVDPSSHSHGGQFCWTPVNYRPIWEK